MEDNNGNMEYVEGQKILRKILRKTELYVSEDYNLYILSKDKSGNRILRELYASGGYDGALPDLSVRSVDIDTPYILLDEEDENDSGK